MPYYLAKTEPGTYSIEDLKREGTTTWDGVTNPQAVNVIRAMKPGDRVFIYHSGSEPQVVGLAKVHSEPRPDPKNAKSAVVDLQYLATLREPIPLAEIKAERKFADWALVRQGRLSTMAAPEEFVDWVRRKNPDQKI